MSDNVSITAGSGTTIATDDIGGGVQVQRVKNTWGVDGTATDVTATTPLPTNITDGTTIASTFAGDTGFNGIVSGNGLKTLSNWVYTGAGNSATIDMANYSEVSAQLIAKTSSSSGNITVQSSNDGTNWTGNIPAMAVSSLSTGIGTILANPNVGEMIYVSRYGRYLRFTAGSTVNGTNTWAIVLSPLANPGKATNINVNNTTSTPVNVLFTSSAVATIVTGTNKGTSDGTAGGLVPTVSNFPFLFNGATWDRERTPALYATVTATASGDTAIVTSTAGKKLRLHGYSIEVSAGAAISGGGVDLDVVLRDVTAAIGQGITSFVPTLAATTAVGSYSSGWRDLGNGKLMAANQTAFNVNLSSTLTSGKVRVNIAYSEE